MEVRYMSFPNLLAYDIEAAKPGSRKDWTTPEKQGVSVICGWGLSDPAPHIWLVDPDRIPRALVSQKHCLDTFEKYEGVVTWNGIEYDDRVLKKAGGLFPDIRKTYASKRHIDLMAICCLIQAGVEHERLLKLESGWASMVPTMRSDLVQTGWSLDSVGKATLGWGKHAGPQGKEAIEAWQQGRYSEVSTYCIWDVALLKGLYIHAYDKGWLESEERGRVEIPRELLLP